MLAIPPQFDHQVKTTNYLSPLPYGFDMSDPGTGKTRSLIDTIDTLQKQGSGRALVLCPKSITRAAWGKDIRTYAPHMTFCIATNKNREEALKNKLADIVITNHDAVRYIDPKWIDGYFGILVIDESTAFKNPGSKRTKAVFNMRQYFKHIYLMSGTAIPNTVLDIWAQMFILDEGERLGKSFYGFRMATCAPQQVGRDAKMVRWIDKPGAVDAVSGMISDCTIRHIFEECIDIPPHSVHNIETEIPAHVLMEYQEFIAKKFMDFGNPVPGSIDPVHAADFMNKLLQITAGTVYDQTGGMHCMFEDRYELIMDLVEERQQCVIAFLWKHQRDKLTELAAKRGFTFAVIDGDTSDDTRLEAVEAFQRGELRIIFAHPQTGAHGLTLTRGTTTIWTSPTYNLEHYLQFNKRIYRAGQTRKTETIHICALDTIETEVYNRLQEKQGTLDDLLMLVSQQY